MFQFNYQKQQQPFTEQPFTGKDTGQILAKYLRNRFDTIRLAYQALDVLGLGWVTRDVFTAGLQQLDYPYINDAQQLFDVMLAAQGDGVRVPMDVLVSFLEKSLEEAEGQQPTLTPQRMTTSERLELCTGLSGSPKFRELPTGSIASNSTGSCTGGASPGSDSGAAISEEVTIELENLRVHFGRRINALEDEFQNRIERLEAQLGAICAETRDECKEKVQEVQAGVLAIAEKAANLAASTRDGQGLGAPSTMCSMPLHLEDMVSEKLEQATCGWQASLTELKAVSEERWWGIQAHVGVLSTKIEDLLRECKMSTSSEGTTLFLEETNNSLHTASEVASVDDLALGSMLLSEKDMLQPAKNPNAGHHSSFKKLPAWGGVQVRFQTEMDGLSDPVSLASKEFSPGIALPPTASNRVPILRAA